MQRPPSCDHRMAAYLGYTVAMSIVICFVDGLGLTAPATPPWTTAHVPTLSGLLGVVPHRNLRIETPLLHFHALDATLGVQGLPQSGTGHTTLWTGRNASALLGRHYPAYPAPSQRPLIEEATIFGQIQAAGYRVALATVHRSPYWELVTNRQQRATAAALAARAAGLSLPDLNDFIAGRAVTWDITGQYLRRWGALEGVADISPFEAGRRLAALAQTADVVHYECYLPDFVGHQRIEESPERVLELIDTLLAGILAHLHPHDSLLLVSDHGNIEEPEHQRHTMNPVPLLVVGPGAPHAASAHDLSDVAATVLAMLTAPTYRREC